jgi:hypothetical protein
MAVGLHITWCRLVVCFLVVPVRPSASRTVQSAPHQPPFLKKNACPATCISGSLPSLSCPFVVYHVQKTAGSSLRHVVHSAVARHNISAFIPCYDDIPCPIGSVLELMLNCFERQSAFAFDGDDMKMCLHATLEPYHWKWIHALQLLPQPDATNPVPLAVTTLRSLSCASVIVAHITPTVLTRAALLFRQLHGSDLSRSLGLCSGPVVACASCWATVREPLSRTLSHVKHFHPSFAGTRYPAADAVIKVLHDYGNASAIAELVEGNLQSTYVTPMVLKKCNVMIFETLQHDVRTLFASQPWLGTLELPVVNNRALAHAEESTAIQILQKLGIEHWLQNDIALYNKVVKQRRKGVTTQKETDGRQ